MRSLWAAILGGSVLVACGGGGGDDDDTPATGTVVITATNQDRVARAAAGAVVSLGGAASGGGLTASEPSTSLALVRQSATRLAAARKRALAIPSETVNCSVSGSVTVSFVDADNDGAPTVGDTMTTSFANCKETADDNLSGSFAVRLTLLDVDSNGLLRFDGTVTFSQLAATVGERSATLSGSASMTYAQRSSTRLDVTLSIGTSGLSSSLTADGVTETIGYDPEFAYTETSTFDANTGTLVSTSTLVRGGFSSSAIGGSVILDTQQAVMQFAGEAYPRAGVLRVVGDSSALRLTALPGELLRLELDANLDGNYEASRDVPWQDLLPT
jgi:hypothetical protein